MVQNPIKITDTTFRDAHQSLMATRLRTDDMIPIASKMDSMGFYSMEVWGGATFDAMTRFLGEDPWDRLRTFKKLITKTPLSMLLRGQALVGYRAYADDLVETFVNHSAEAGIDIFRVFDALNDEWNLDKASSAVKMSGKHLQLTICYSVTGEGKLGGDIYNLQYYIDKAKRFQEMGADSICLKDMAGLMSPYDAYTLVTNLKEVLDIPLQLHTHYTSGMASMTVLKAIEAGVDIVDTCLAPLALRTSQPASEPLVVTFQGTERDSGLNLEGLLDMGDYLESILPKYREHMETTRTSVIDAKVLKHQIPGGMASNLISQLREAEALDRLEEVLKEIPKTREELGFPPLVTPISQMIGSQAVSNVLFGRYTMMSGPVRDHILGLYGRPPGKIDGKVADIVLKDPNEKRTSINQRPANLLAPEVDKAFQSIKEISSTLDDMLIYALYPTTGMRFLRIKHQLDPMPDEMKQKVSVDVINKSDSAIIKESSYPHPSDKVRFFNVYVGEDFYKIGIDPSQLINKPEEAKSEPETSLSENIPDFKSEGISKILAPMPGILVKYLVEIGQKVNVGDPVLVLEAMKMENSLPSPITGTVENLPLKPGSTVGKDAILAVIAPLADLE